MGETITAFLEQQNLLTVAIADIITLSFKYFVI